MPHTTATPTGWAGTACKAGRLASALAATLALASCAHLATPATPANPTVPSTPAAPPAASPAALSAPVARPVASPTAAPALPLETALRDQALADVVAARLRQAGMQFELRSSQAPDFHPSSRAPSSATWSTPPSPAPAANGCC